MEKLKESRIGKTVGGVYSSPNLVVIGEGQLAITVDDVPQAISSLGKKYRIKHNAWYVRPGTRLHCGYGEALIQNIPGKQR